MKGCYSVSFVALSLAVAVIASYTALDLANRSAVQLLEGRQRVIAAERRMNLVVLTQMQHQSFDDAGLIIDA
jgi:CHASE3 domain sensor protein